MPQTLNSTSALTEPAMAVLVVATEAPVRARLAAQVWRALPSAQVHELSQLTDLVYRVAGSSVDLVVLDAQPFQPLPLTPLLVQMLKGIHPALRIVSVARAAPAVSSVAPATDASLTEASFGDWLCNTYGIASGGQAAAGAPSTHVV